MLKKSIYIFFIIFLFLFIYDPPLAIINFNLTTLFAVISISYLICRFFIIKKVSVKVLRYLAPFLIILFLSVYSFLLPLFFGTNDYQVARLLLIFILIYLPTSYTLIILIKQYFQFTLRDLFKAIVWISVIQSVIILMMFLNADFKGLIYSLLRDDRTEFNLLSGGIRMLGFAYSTVWDMSFVQSISVIMIVYLIQGRSILKVLAYSIAYILIFISIIFSGRTGFIGIFLSIILLVLVPISRNGFISKASFWFPVSITTIITGVLIILSILLPTDVKDTISDKVVPWAFEVFINKSQSGKLQTESSDELKTMYFPVSKQTFVVGDGRYKDPVDPDFYYKDTDAGYMRHILFYGIVGSSILYTFYLLIFLILILSCYKHHLFPLAILYVFLLIYYFVAHVKGDLFVGAAMPLRTLFLLYVFHSMIKERKQYGF